MKVFKIILFLLFSISLKAQFLKTECDQQIEYLIPDIKEYDSYFFNTQKKYPTYKIRYSQGDSFKDSEVVDFGYVLKNKKYPVQGHFFNQKYIIVNGCCGSYSNESGKIKLKKIGGKFQIKNYTCEQYKSEIGKTKQYAIVYTTNLNDGVDYNILMQQIGNSNGIEIPKLKQGELIIQIGMLYDKGYFWVTNEFVSSKKVIQEFIASEEAIKDVILSIPQKKVNEDLTKQPAFCYVESHDSSDEKVDDRVTYFLSRMCEYYDVFGKNDTDAFYDYFEDDIARKVRFLKTHKVLTSKQLISYEKILKKYLSQNNTSKIDKVKEYVKSKLQ